MTDRETALRAIELISPARATSYETWLEVGIALYNAGCGVDDWMRWHPDGAKDHEATCIKKWNSFASYKGPKRTIASLIKWAKDDSGIDPRADITSTPGQIVGFNDSFSISSGWNQSADIEAYAKAVFRPGDIINIVTKSAVNDKGKHQPAGLGNYKITYDELVSNPMAAIGDYSQEAGVWIRHNPLDGKGVNNANVTEFRHVLIENDDLPVEKQLAIIEQLMLPCAAVVDSGNKSIHAIVRIDAGTSLDDYKERVLILFDILEQHGLKADKACRNPARLSRIPGVYRSGRRQRLIATNSGCASWGEWIDYIKKKDCAHVSFGDLLKVDMEKEDDSLITPRFLYREGSWMIVSQSGIGKSSLLMQMAVCFSMGNGFFGLQPVTPLRCLIVQAENNRLDMAEFVKGIAHGMALSDDDMKIIEKNLIILSEDTKSGTEFCNFLDVTVAALAPVDIVFIDPLFAYAGCDLSKQGDVSKFLRNSLNPVIHKHGFGCVVCHHTNKIKKKAQDDDYNLEYIGAGSAELTNWARAVSVIEKIGENPVTGILQHVKRGNRLRAQKSITIHHAEGYICWEQDEPATLQERDKAREIARMMPVLFNRKDHDDPESIWRWCRDNLKLSRSECERFVDSQRKSAERDLKKVQDQGSGPHWTGCF